MYATDGGGQIHEQWESSSASVIFSLARCMQCVSRACHWLSMNFFGLFFLPEWIILYKYVTLRFSFIFNTTFNLLKRGTFSEDAQWSSHIWNFTCRQKIFLKRKLTETLRQIYSMFGGKPASKSDLKTPKVTEDASVERDGENKAGSFSVLLSSTVAAQWGPSRPVLRECFLLVESERYCIAVQLSHSEDSRSLHQRFPLFPVESLQLSQPRQIHFYYCLSLLVVQRLYFEYS